MCARRGARLFSAAMVFYVWCFNRGIVLW